MNFDFFNFIYKNFDIIFIIKKYFSGKIKIKIKINREFKTSLIGKVETITKF